MVVRRRSRGAASLSSSAALLLLVLVALVVAQRSGGALSELPIPRDPAPSVVVNGEATPQQPRVDADPRVLECGDLNVHGVLTAQRVRPGEDLDSDHVPSNAALRKRAQTLLFGAPLTSAQEKRMRESRAYRTIEREIRDSGLAIAIPSSAHKALSRTYGGRNPVSRQLADARNLEAAARRDLAAIQEGLSEHDPACPGRYAIAAARVARLTNADYDRAIERVLARSVTETERAVLQSTYGALLSTPAASAQLE